jgi:hypothetical protein
MNEKKKPSLPSFYRTIFLKKYNDLFEIEKLPITNLYEENKEKEIEKNQVLIKVKCSGINRIDYYIKKGFFSNFLFQKFQNILGTDSSGVIVDIGNEVNNFKSIFLLLRKYKSWG